MFTQLEKAVQSIPVNDSEVLETETDILEIIEPATPIDKLEESIKRSIQVVEDTETAKQQKPEIADRIEESIKSSIKATEEY